MERIISVYDLWSSFWFNIRMWCNLDLGQIVSWFDFYLFGWMFCFNLWERLIQMTFQQRQIDYTFSDNNHTIQLRNSNFKRATFQYSQQAHNFIILI